MPALLSFTRRLAPALWATGCACALVLSGCANRPQASTPTSDLPRDSALNLARLTAASIGGYVFTIAPTGSMKPTLDETSIVAVEPTLFRNLRAGDIVIYTSAQGAPVIHRLIKRNGTGHWQVLGDNNSAPDAETVTETNFVGRVCAIFYTSTRLPGETAAFASRPGVKIPAESPKIH